MNIVLLPYLGTLLAAVLCLVFWGRLKAQRSLSILGALFHLGSSLCILKNVSSKGIHVLALSSWPGPYGITLVADLFASMMLVITGLLGLMIFLYAGRVLDSLRQKNGFYFLSNVLILGVSAAFLTGDLFNLYVCFELLLIASFMLLSLGKEKLQLEGSLKYVVINVFSSLCFLVGVALIYGHAGTLNMAHLAQIFSEASFELSIAEQCAGLLLFLAFAMKAGLFPLFFWLPTSYHTVPSTITALFSGLLTKVGAYSLIRVFTLVFPLSAFSLFKDITYVLAILTMVIGVMGAVSQFSIKRILSVHIISQIGYIILALALFTPLSLGAAIYYLIHNMLAKTNLFLAGGIVEREEGTDDLKLTGGLLKKYPALALYFFISALALAGLPPLSGFFAKVFVLRTAFQAVDYTAVFFILAVSVLTLYSMLKIWNYVFWSSLRKELPESGTHSTGWMPRMVVAVMAVSLILMGLYAGPLYEFTLRAGQELFNSSNYINAVLMTGGS